MILIGLMLSVVVVGVALGASSLDAYRKLRAAEAVQARCAHRRAELSALLETVPLVSFRWSASREDDDDSASYVQFRAGLAVDAADQVEAARLALQRTGAAFSIPVTAPGGTACVVEGRRSAAGETVLWLVEDKAAAARQAHDEAAARAACLREMIDAIPMPVWRRDQGFAIAECNRAYAATLGISRGAVLAGGRELVPATVMGDPPEPVHVVIDGSRRLLEITEAAAPGGGMIGFAVDRTEVETAQAELWRHVDAHAEVLEGIHAAVAVFAADKRLKFFNAAYAALWGMDAAWLTLEPTLDEVLEWLRERRRLPEYVDFRAFKRERATLFTTLIETRQELLHLPDGRTLRLSISPHPLGGLLFVHEDVTDHLALECSYNTLAQVQRATLDHLSEGVAVYGSDGRLKLHNPAFRAIWDLSAEDVADEPHISRIAEKIRGFLDDGSGWAARKQAIVARIAAQMPTSGPLYRRDGSMLQQAVVPLPDGNVLLTYLDVSDTARVEQALRDRNEALETAGRLKSEFIANVSYELRTPLNAVIGFAEILTNQYFGPLNARQLDYSRNILDSAHQLMTLIDDIIDLATIEAGYMVLEPGRVEIAEMLQGVVSLTAERARSRGLEIALRCPPKIGFIRGDERRLKQALFNLISNAIKFTPPGGAISIAAERAGSDLLLTVADTGIAIPPADDRSRNVEAFKRGAYPTGVGLGLSLVKSLVELHGGTVAIEPAPRCGTRIVCRLPAGPMPAPHYSARRGADPAITAPAATASS